jgi:hypothetical protein
VDAQASTVKAFELTAIDGSWADQIYYAAGSGPKILRNSSSESQYRIGWVVDKLTLGTWSENCTGRSQPQFSSCMGYSTYRGPTRRKTRIAASREVA